MKRLIAALHESGKALNGTNRAGLLMSVVRGRPEVALRGRQDRFGQPAQPVDATQALNLSAGVSNCKV